MLNSKNKSFQNIKINKKITIDDIEKLYQSNNSDFKIGIEYERISLDKNTLKVAKYEQIENIIKEFSKILDWELIFDKNTIIGAKNKENSSISLEPGMQLEISLAPYQNLKTIENKLKEYIALLDNIAKMHNVIFLGYGINPQDSTEEIPLLNKQRYQIMDRYLPNVQKGKLSQKMMRKTAGIQVNIDYFNYEDLYDKLKFANLIMPFIQGLSSNSIFENNSLSEFYSTRANIWHNTGKERCNFFYKNIFNDNQKTNIITDYIKEILKVPMIYLEKEKNIEIKGKFNFDDYMKDKIHGYTCTLDDYKLHQSLCFPDVRLKKYIEIRNHDSADINTVLAYAALYKGLFNQNMDKLKRFYNLIDFNQTENYSILSAKFGLNYKLKNNISAWKIANELLNISKNNLDKEEQKYLKPLEYLISKKKTYSDIIKENKIGNVRNLISLLININELA